MTPSYRASWFKRYFSLVFEWCVLRFPSGTVNNLIVFFYFPSVLTWQCPQWPHIRLRVLPNYSISPFIPLGIFSFLWHKNPIQGWNACCSKFLEHTQTHEHPAGVPRTSDQLVAEAAIYIIIIIINPCYPLGNIGCQQNTAIWSYFWPSSYLHSSSSLFLMLPLPTQHTKNTIDDYLCPQRDWNPRSQQ